MAKKRISQKVRQLVQTRASYHCEYCYHPESFANHFYSIEHIIPSSKGGADDPTNLAYACQCCNSHKYNKTEAPDPISGQFVPLFHPRGDLWNDHFAWSNDFLKINGISPTGRATIDALDMNRESLIRLRNVLYFFGKHPPKHLKYN